MKKIKFTKRQQTKIDNCSDNEIKQLLIQHFTNVQKIEQKNKEIIL